MRAPCFVPLRSSLSRIVRAWPWLCGAVACGLVAMCSGRAYAEELTVQLTTPKPGEHVSRLTRILISTTDPDGVTYVALYKDGAVMATDFTPPYEFFWQTHADAEGPHTLMAKAVSAKLREATTPRLTVTVDNTPPSVTLTAPADHATIVGVVTLQAKAADVLGLRSVQCFLDGTTLAEGTQPPYGFTWDTRAIPNGHHTLQARAIDLAGNDATSEAVTVWVANPNDPPVLEPPAPTTVLEGRPWTLRLKATDPNAPRDPLTYTAEKLPAWVHLDPQTGILSGTPSYDEASRDKPLVPSLGVIVRACDPEPLCDQHPLALSVMNANRPPLLKPVGHKVVDEGELLVIHLEGSDPDHDPLICRIKQLPPWMKFDADRCLARGVPHGESSPLTEPDMVYADVVAEVCDPDGLCASEPMTIKVANVGNQPPVLTVASAATIEEGKRLTLEVQADDPEHESVTLTAESLPDGATFFDHTDGTGLFNWTPRYDQRGTYEVIVKAADKEKNSTKKIRGTVKEAGLAISGFIKDVLGAPVEGALVELATSKESIRTVSTDAHGYYLVSGFRPGTYFLSPSYQLKEAFSPVSRTQLEVTFAPAKARVTVDETDQTGTDFTATFP